MKASLQDSLQRLLNSADIRLNGSRPWDVQVHNSGLYKRAIAGGSLGVGEAYMDGWWDCRRLDDMLTRVFMAQIDHKLVGNLRILLKMASTKIINPQTLRRAFVVGQRHYDLGNDLYEAMLDSRLTYSCGYWKTAKDLDQAQTAKLDLICRKLDLKPGMALLDIGCGWGSLMAYAAEKYKVKATGVTVSSQQADYIKKRYKHLPISVRLADYRTLSGQFDRIASVGMFEHVGAKNYQTFMKVAERCLKDDGLFLLHTIGSSTPHFGTDPWIDKYIFPNSLIPAASMITKAYEGKFVMEDWQNFGPDYDKTLQAWHKNFNKAWPQLKGMYDERFRRMWNFYLMASMAQFRTRKLQLWQIVLSKDQPQRYDAPR
ncbi:MAG: cfa [Candidatus Saccharibacteria bacterium]|nr:cfa [Candidatus Saccharibacteria bacterium]